MRPLRLRHRLALLLLVAPLIGGTASRPAQAAPATVTEAQREDLRRVESLLNDIKTLRARFIQTAPDGRTDQGLFTLSRPGRMRVQYDPPNNNFIVADGTFVYFWDAEAKEQSNAPIGSTLADFLLRPEIKLSGDVTVTSVTADSGLIEVTLQQAKDPGLGRLTLVFGDAPLRLRKWRVLDAQGLTTEVALQNPEVGVALDADQFYFRAPTRKRERD